MICLCFDSFIIIFFKYCDSDIKECFMVIKILNYVFIKLYIYVGFVFGVLL